MMADSLTLKRKRAAAALALGQSARSPITTSEDLSSRLLTGAVNPSEAGAPAGVRAMVGGLTKPEDRLAELRRTFPTAAFDPVSGRLVFINPETNEPTFYNPEGLDVGDVASVAREAAQGVGGAAGAAVGLAAGGPTPAALATVPAAAGVGTALGEEAFNAGIRALGAEDTRSLPERAGETGTIGALGAVGQGAGSALGAGLRSAVKGAARTGTSRSEIESAIDDLARFDASPSIAQATKSQALDGLEGLISKVPGGAGVFRRVVGETTSKIAKSLERKIATTTGRTAVDPEFVGKVVAGGIDDPLGAGFKQRFRNTANQLYEEIGIPADRQVTIGNTAEAVQGLNLLPDVPAINKLITSPTVRGLAGAEALPSTLPYEALSRMRTAIGQRISSPSLTSDIPTADLKRVYAALSQDMEKAAGEVGAGALSRFTRANRFYKAGVGRIEDTLQGLSNKATPEALFNSLQSGIKQGPTQVRTLMRSLKPGERKAVVGGLVRRLGQPTAGQATGEAEEFSFNTFLTNWNKIDPAAKNAMFGAAELKGLGNELEALARASGRVRESGRAFANPPGSGAATVGQTAAFVGTGSAIAGALSGSTGMLGLPAVLALSAGAFNGTARLLTSPRFVRWLTKATKIEPNGAAAHLGRLAGIAAAEDDETREAILDYANQFGAIE